MAYGKKRIRRRSVSRRPIKRRRTMRRRSRSKYSAVSVARPLVPPSRTMKLRYVESGIKLNASTGQSQFYLMSGNSLYDPNQSGSGHQPYYFDQLTTFYEKYCVLWSKISVKATTTDASRLFKVSIIPSLSSSWSISETDLAQEIAGNRTTVFTGFQMSKGIGMVANSRKTKTLLGVKDVLDDPDNFGLTGNLGTGSGPGNEWYWIIVVQCCDLAVDPVDILLDIQMDYIAKFTDRRNINDS